MHILHSILRYFRSTFLSTSNPWESESAGVPTEDALFYAARRSKMPYRAVWNVESRRFLLIKVDKP